jgi:hypothetical protein
MLTKLQLRQFEDAGYTLTDKLFTDTQLDQMVAKIEEARQEWGKTMRGNNPFVCGLERSQQFAMDTLTAKPMLEAAMQLLGPDLDIFSGSQIAYKPARSGSSFIWHQDGGYSDCQPAHYLTVWLALDDATVENGTIWVIPGSHKWGRLTHRRSQANPNDMVGYDESHPYQGVPVEAKRGQAAMFSSLTLHKSGPNTTDRPRRAWVMQYCPPGTFNPRNGALYSAFAVTRNGKRLCERFPVRDEIEKHRWAGEVIEGNAVPAAEIAKLAAASAV